MEENVTENLVDEVFKNLDFLKKIIIFSVNYINKRFTNLHIVEFRYIEKMYIFFFFLPSQVLFWYHTFDEWWQKLILVQFCITLGLH